MTSPLAIPIERLAPQRRGSRHGLAKLTEPDVIEIRRRAAAGEMQRDLAAHYGVSQSTVSRIIARGIWIHV